MKKITIAIDGHSSCGKSTMAKDLAREVGYVYVDTGAMYRCVTLYALRHGLFTAEGIKEDALRQQMPNIKISFKFNAETGRPDTYLNGELVEKDIRTMEVSNHVSPIATLGFVREAMVAQQQEMGQGGGVVMDGRDIGTVVFPHAELKVFVTASAEVRAQRRYDELKGKGMEADYEDILKNVQERDYIDSHREVSPLRQADDAILLDNSHMTIAEQKEWLMEHFKAAVGTASSSSNTIKKMLTLLLILLPLAMFAQTRKVSGTYTYHSDPSMSPKQAFAAAIEYAQKQALAKEFGTMMVQHTISEAEMKNGKESEYFSQQNTEEVKGEWIEDTKAPETKIVATMNDGSMVIEAKVWGKAREVSNETVEFEAIPLRNGTEKRFADHEFLNGDQLYLYFTSPADGYVAVYLIDESKTASCLLPYGHDNNGQQSVKHGEEYYFFSKEHPYNISSSIVDEYQLFCGEENFEQNQLYVIFSPNPFTKTVDKQTSKTVEVNGIELNVPRELSFENFQKWLGKLGARDKEMGKKVIRLIVKKK